jgi:hypothetical protein
MRHRETQYYLFQMCSRHRKETNKVPKFSYNVETAQIELLDSDGNSMSIGYIEDVALFPQKSRQAVAALNAVLELVIGNRQDRQFVHLVVGGDGRQQTAPMK